MSELLLQSPPGQINEVYNDLVQLTTVDKSMFKKYNLDQNIPILLKPENHTIVLGNDVELIQDDVQEETEMIAWKGSLYRVDHTKLEATLVEGKSVEFAEDPKREIIEKHIAEYVDNFFQNGVFSVHKVGQDYAIYIVSNSYNPSNFWAGRWRESWHVKNSTLEGSLAVQVHYYEDGNVQLNSSHSVAYSDLPQDTNELAATLVKHIQKASASYQTIVNNSFVDSGANTFKNLRRVLPITRSKIEWASILTCIIFSIPWLLTRFCRQSRRRTSKKLNKVE